MRELGIGFEVSLMRCLFYEFDIPQTDGIPSGMPELSVNEALVVYCDDGNKGKWFHIESLNELQQIEHEYKESTWRSIQYYAVVSSEIASHY